MCVCARVCACVCASTVALRPPRACVLCVSVHPSPSVFVSVYIVTCSVSRVYFLYVLCQFPQRQVVMFFRTLGNLLPLLLLLLQVRVCVCVCVCVSMCVCLCVWVCVCRTDEEILNCALFANPFRRAACAWIGLRLYQRVAPCCTTRRGPCCAVDPFTHSHRPLSNPIPPPPPPPLRPPQVSVSLHLLKFCW